MSAAEILSELPKLKAGELRAIRQRVMELAQENEETAQCDLLALEGAQLIDQLEDEDARRGAR